MDISVIIPCLNVARYLRRCLDAVCRQNCAGRSCEVILIDNGSTDASVEIARGYPQLKILAEPAPSSYMARNRGIRAARGKWLAFTDSDCETGPGWIEQLAGAFADPATALVLGSVRNANEQHALKMLADYEDEKTSYVFSQHDRSLYYGYGGNMAVRRDVFDRCGLFREVDRGADTVFLCDVVETFGPEAVRHVPAARVRHLEIGSVSDWYSKLAIYGRSHQRYSRWSTTRTLSLRERFKVMRSTAARNSYSWLERLQFAALLAGGAAAYEVGRIRGGAAGGRSKRMR